MLYRFWLQVPRRKVAPPVSSSSAQPVMPVTRTVSTSPGAYSPPTGCAEEHPNPSKRATAVRGALLVPPPSM
jgi:hypothetical protein